MFKNMKVGTRLIAGFLFLSILGAIVGGIGIANMSKINDKAADLYQKELLGISYIKEANINLIYIGRSVRNLLLASTQGDRDKFVADIDKARRQMKSNIDMAKPLFYTREGKESFAEFERKLSEYEALLPELAKRMQTEQLQESREVVQYVFSTFKEKGDAADDMITVLSNLKEKNARDADELTTQLYQSSRIFMIILVVGSTLAGLALGLLITRSITRPLNQAVSVAQAVAAGDLTSQIEVSSKDETGRLLQALKEMNSSLQRIVGEVRGGAETIATASNQIAAGNLDLSSRTEEQASSLEETASSMEELTSTVKQNAENARQANGLAISASEVALKGGTVVSQVVDTMGSINESARKIADIIGVVDSIAFQTNILALNAAVEAARAGEQGRGFAVVATEVRTLAQRSAGAAKEIKTLIDESVAKVGAGTKLVDQAGVTMDDIVESVKRVTDIMGEISAATQEQTAGIEQINQAIIQMDQVTQQNASLVEQSAAASEAMQEQAKSLAQTVSIFRIDGAQATLAARVPSLPRQKAGVEPVVRKVFAQNGTAAAPQPRHVAIAQTTAGNDWEQF